MKFHVSIILLFLLPVLLSGQGKETIYSLNEGVTTNKVSKNHSIIWGPTKDMPQASYVRIKEKSDGTYYINVSVGGQFAYGHYFRFVEMEGDEFKYIKTDQGQDDYLYVSHSLTALATSNRFDEHIVMKLINYRTSFAMLMKF